jgi:hypothetical protein
MTMRITTTLAASMLLAAAAAGAQDFKQYGVVGDWRIAVNEDMGPGCVAVRKFVNPTSQVQMGIDATNPDLVGYFAVYARGVEAIEGGNEIPATFDVDGQVFNGALVSQQIDGFGGAFASVSNPDFIYDLATRDTLTINFGEGQRLIVSLAETDEAFAMLRSCQQSL